MACRCPRDEEDARESAAIARITRRIQRALAPLYAQHGQPGTEASIILLGVLEVHVCAPVTWGDAEVAAFVEGLTPSHSSAGWRVRAGSTTDCPLRAGHVHLVAEV